MTIIFRPPAMATGTANVKRQLNDGKERRHQHQAEQCLGQLLELPGLCKQHQFGSQHERQQRRIPYQNGPNRYYNGY